jgi:RNA polymerase sigma factor (TIGR02999 family)
MNEVTRILSDLAGGDPRASDQLLPLVYAELRQLAVQRMAQEKPGQTLQATALVHEAYLRLVGGNATGQWDGRGHFFAAAAEAMRRILVEKARHKRRRKHGGGLHRQDLNESDIRTKSPNEDVLAVDEALQAFELVDPQVAVLVKLHYFSGFSLQDAAQALGISERTAYRDWAYARAWLARFLDRAEHPAEKD